MKNISSLRRISGLLCALLLTTAAVTGCAERKASPAEPIDASQVSFEPTIYNARGGRLRFLYDSETDMLTAIEGSDTAVLYSGGTYSMVVSYDEGTLDRKEADSLIRQEFSAGDLMTLSEKTENQKLSGHTFRRAGITCADGSGGAVCYGNTETGFLKIYYIIAPDAAASTQSHVEEIISTIRVAEFGENEKAPGFTNIYVQP